MSLSSEEYRQAFRAKFLEQVQLPEEQQHLATAALYLAGEHCLSLVVDAHLAHLTQLAADAKAQLNQANDAGDLFRGLSRFMFEEVGFSGNRENYYHPDNSFLNRVLDTRKGIPITLSLVFLDLAKRVGLECYGVGMPGHFLVGLAELDLYVDPFNQGLLLSAADCRRQVMAGFQGRVPWQEEFLAPCTNRDILFRMLTNLKYIYMENKDYPAAVAVLERQLILNSSHYPLFKELAWCHLNLDEQSAASDYSQRFVEAASAFAPSGEARRQMREMWELFHRSRGQSDLQ